MHDSSMHDSSTLSPMLLLRGAERVVDAAAAQLVAMQNGPLVATRKELRDIVTTSHETLANMPRGTQANDR